jgi:hypothetical protein
MKKNPHPSDLKKWKEAGLLSPQLTSAQIRYSQTPSNKLSIEQILRGERQAIWENTASGNSSVKKTLIITDWFCAQNVLDNEQYFITYRKLLAQGFKLSSCAGQQRQ